MRAPTIVLLSAALAAAGCGDDGPPEPETPREGECAYAEKFDEDVAMQIDTMRAALGSGVLVGGELTAPPLVPLFFDKPNSRPLTPLVFQSGYPSGQVVQCRQTDPMTRDCRTADAHTQTTSSGGTLVGTSRYKRSLTVEPDTLSLGTTEPADDFSHVHRAFLAVKDDLCLGVTPEGKFVLKSQNCEPICVEIIQRVN